MGIGYDSKVVIYNRTGGELGKPCKWYGTELTKVRVELTQKVNASTGGAVSASTCTIKINDADLPKAVVSLAEWKENTQSLAFGQDTVFIITEKADINRSVDAPTGEILDKAYTGGLLSYLQETYGMTYKVVSAEHYSLIPHWAVNGA